MASRHASTVHSRFILLGSVLTGLLAAPGPEVCSHVVSTEVNAVRNNAPHLIDAAP